MGISREAFEIFEKSIREYHKKNEVDQEFKNPFSPDDTLNHLLYRKNWIDTVQWHLEDIIRDPQIDAEHGMVIKRKIDASNQDRTDMVEFIDSYYLEAFHGVVINDDATFNTESPAWALDRLSILALKIYHMDEEANRSSASAEHRQNCQVKLLVLLEQKKDLCTSIDVLLDDMANGRKYMKVYKQMKMYNDDDLNPVLYGTK